MDPITQQTVLAAAGAAGGDPVYVDDVFSTTLYEGQGQSGTALVTGINNTEDTALIWIKQRSAARHHVLIDTVRGANNTLFSNLTSAQNTTGGFGINSFESDGVKLANALESNLSGEDYVAWNFKAAPGFFDVVTYTGNGTAGKQIAHNLGSMPGMIIVKKTSGTGHWFTANLRADGAQYIFHRLNASSASFTSDLVANVADASNVIIDGTSNGGAGSFANAYSGAHAINENGATYVAYIFAHNDAQFGTDEDESIIKCGSYTGTGNTGLAVNVGFEPQFLLVKTTTSNEDFVIVDNMRGVSDSQRVEIWPGKSNAEYSTTYPVVKFTSTGFETVGGSNSMWNNSGGAFIYMAIRRPHKPPEAGTEVFAIDTWGGTSPTPPTYISGFPVDAAIRVDTSGGNKPWVNRLMGIKFPYANSANAEDSASSFVWDYMNGWASSTGTNSAVYSYMFKRAPGFFDVVAYSGTSSNRAVNHNLEAVPELMFVKVRNHSEDWNVYNFIDGPTKYLRLNLTQDIATSSIMWNDTAPTSSVFNLGTYIGVNGSGKTYVAYLFATLPGISKVGSYTGNGGTQNIDCGFTNGARFVLIKRTDAAADWYVFDTLRGIGSGNDPSLKLNSTDAQNAGENIINPLAAGFTLNTAYTAFNGSGGTYLFLAIA